MDYKCLRKGFMFTAIIFPATFAAKFSAPESNDANFITSQLLEEPFPFDYPNVNAAPESLFPMASCRNFTLAEATIDQLQSAMSQGQLTAVDIVDCYIERVEQTNGYLNGVLQLNPDARDIASNLDKIRSAGQVLGPLHGVPFLVKDNIATKDRIPTTAGSWMLLSSVVPRDAHVVSRLRAAGAILMGHATLSEWADMRSNNYSEGYSARGGQARSPYNLTVNPGGSSSGSAVAVAGNQVMVALGTETDGSVINPAERNAIVGIKPTVGLTSRAGVIPESVHQDTVGTFGRTVKDATYVLDAIYGPDHRDNYTNAQIGQSAAYGYVRSLADKSALQGAKFGLPWQSFWALNSPNQNSQLSELLSLIEEAGADILNHTELPNYDTIVSQSGWDWDYGSTRGFPNESEYTVVKVDFYNNIRDYLAEVGNTNLKGLEDIVQYNMDNLGAEGGFPGINPAFGSGQDGFLASLRTKGVMDETYFQALDFCQRNTRELGIDAALENNGNRLDALLVPPDVGQTYQIAAQAGYPMVTLPAGINEAASGMPYGLALMGTAWSEPTLLRLASAIEDLQFNRGTPYKRTLPQWRDYQRRVLPVTNA
ncbi:MAG: hypothetical protein Q9227_000869 [Pyrenula ochraceoflavens]